MNKSLQVSSSSPADNSVLVNLHVSQEINIQNMNVELVAQMFKNYQSNVLFHLEGTFTGTIVHQNEILICSFSH